jgi:hypothetical protein
MLTQALKNVNSVATGQREKNQKKISHHGIRPSSPCIFLGDIGAIFQGNTDLFRSRVKCGGFILETLQIFAGESGIRAGKKIFFSVNAKDENIRKNADLSCES